MIHKYRNPKFVLSNARVDRNQIDVAITSNYNRIHYSLSTDVSTINASSRVYYTQENEEATQRYISLH